MVRKKLRELMSKREWCKGCGICVALCPKQVVELDADEKLTAVRPEDCICCRMCELRCPDLAITVLTCEEDAMAHEIRLVIGNEACVEGALYAGLSFFAGYPITPSTDSRFMQTTRKVDARQVELPVYEMVMRAIGKTIVCNICVFGALIGLADLVRPKSVLEAIKDRVQDDFVEINTTAFHLGFDLGRPFRR